MKKIEQDILFMDYADNLSVKDRLYFLTNQLIDFLADQASKYKIAVKDIYIPDLHGDIIHLILTLHNHNLLDGNLNLSKDHNYIFLGDVYDRGEDACLIDAWINVQVLNGSNIIRLLGNHELGFLIRKNDGLPLLHPAQDSINDVKFGFQITESLLKNMSQGNIKACHLSDLMIENYSVFYVHSYIIEDDFKELGISVDSPIKTFSNALNTRLMKKSKEAYEIFLRGKSSGVIDWTGIRDVFLSDLMFNPETERNDMKTSFLWRRSGIANLNIYPNEILVKIPDKVYQIVGHTPVFKFNMNDNSKIKSPIIYSSSLSNGKVQFSDVGMGYFYDSDSFERPEVRLDYPLICL